MTQNRSTAVMQRRTEPHDSLDYFPTPPWAVRALCEWLRDEQQEPLGDQVCWEPACGELHMVRPLREYFGAVRASDVFRYHEDHAICDFPTVGASHAPVDWVITNPPFRLATDFVQTGLKVARRGVAMLVRSAFIEGVTRNRTLFSVLPPAFMLQFEERVVMLRGRVIRKGQPDPFNLDTSGEPRPASSATAYCWLVWRQGDQDTRLRWLSTPSARLEREGDDPPYDQQWRRVGASAPEALLV